MRSLWWRAAGLMLGAAGLPMFFVLNPSSGSASTAEVQGHRTWSDYLGGADSAQYSALKQIDKSNVNQLQQVWFYPAGNNGFRFGFNPIVVDNVMYVVGKTIPLWRWMPLLAGKFGFTTTINRGASLTAVLTIGRVRIGLTGGSSIPRTMFCTRWMPVLES